MASRAPTREERTQAFLTKVKANPDEHAEEQRDDERLSDADVLMFTRFRKRSRD